MPFDASHVDAVRFAFLFLLLGPFRIILQTSAQPHLE